MTPIQRQRYAEIEATVTAFSDAMRAKLLSKAETRAGWKSDTAVSLLDRVLDEYCELRQALAHGLHCDARKEAVDVANFAMMVWDVLQESKP